MYLECVMLASPKHPQESVTGLARVPEVPWISYAACLCSREHPKDSSPTARFQHVFLGWEIGQAPMAEVQPQRAAAPAWICRELWNKGTPGLREEGMAVPTDTERVGTPPTGGRNGANAQGVHAGN